MDKNKLKPIIVFIIIVIIIAAILNSGVMEPQGEGPDEDLGQCYKYPPKNYPASSGDRDNNEPSVAVNPLDPDNIVAGANDYNTPDGAPWCGYYTSHDGGKNWTEGLIPGYPGDDDTTELTGFQAAGDPVLAVSSEGHFYMAGICFKRATNPINPIGFGYNLGRSNGIFVAKSTNGGDSWDQVEVVWTALQSVVTFHDKEWLAVDPNNGNVYVCWSMFNLLAISQLVFSRSTDGGQTWSRPVVVTEFESAEMAIQGSAIVVDNNGKIHITWIDFNQNRVRYGYSNDEGQSFVNPVSIAPIIPIPRYLENGNYRTPTMTMLAVDNSDSEYSGSLYCTWADYEHGDSDTYLVYSHDGGGTWGEVIRVNNDTVGNGIDQFFPAVAVSDEGYVHVTFYDRRRDANNSLLEYWWAMSLDGGETFPLNLPISDESSNGDYSRDGDNDFIGDYTGVVATNVSINAVWCDMREGSEEDGDSEIYFVRVFFQEVLDNLEFDFEVPQTDE
ncbi:MAG: exo-alpha-sialidase [Thermoplasmata archaeon]|nr:exo-alpha-sialidase [Thermoplasmata archaeon]